MLDFGNWNTSSSDEVKSLIRNSFKSKHFKPVLIIGSNAEHRTLKAELSREFRVVHIENPFLVNSYNAESKTHFNQLFDGFNHTLFDVKLPAREIGPNRKCIWFDPFDLWEKENTIFAFKDIDRFDFTAQIRLARSSNVPKFNNQVIMLIDKNRYSDHFHKELLSNSTKILIDNTKHDNLY